MRNKNAKVPDPAKIFSNPGERMVPIWSPSIDENNNIVCKITGYEDQQEKINAWREQTDMAYILRQMRNGDLSVLNRSEGFYGDISEMPDNMIDALNIVIEREQEFDSLPAEIKQKFDNNFRNWIASFGTDAWFLNMGLNDKIKEEEKVEEVIDNNES